MYNFIFFKGLHTEVLQKLILLFFFLLSPNAIDAVNFRDFDLPFTLAFYSETKFLVNFNHVITFSKVDIKKCGS